ncbi:hypothetical protein [Streptomyces himastatinicus]|nr:hypothetical protein [Streptomyces himastatinicus]
MPVARLFDVEDLVGIPDDDDVEREKRTVEGVPSAPRVKEDGDVRT